MLLLAFLRFPPLLLQDMKKMLFLLSVKKTLCYSVFMITCLYFLSAGNLSLFSKLSKNTQTELLDLDEDADEEGKEAKDSKEDGCDEEVFISLLNASLLPQSHELSDLAFRDPHFFIPKNTVEISSPPPKA